MYVNMDEKLIELFKYLDYKNFVKADEKTLKRSLQKLCDYFSSTQGRKRIKLHFDFHKLFFNQDDEGYSNSAVATSFLDYICLIPDDKLVDFDTYIEMVDCVIHESFHQFQYYFLNIPRELADDVMWQRILAYNIYYIASGKINDFYIYRFCDMELDAYRMTDFLLNKVYKKLKQKGADCERLKVHILDERKEFLKDVRLFKADFGENAKKIVDNWYKKQAIKNIKEIENLDISEKEIFEKMKKGEFLYSIKEGNDIVDVSQKFLDSMSENFKQYLPFLYGKTKPKFDNDKFFELTI